MDDGADEHLEQKWWWWVCWVECVTSVHPAARVRFRLKYGAHENTCTAFACTRLDQISFDILVKYYADALVRIIRAHNMDAAIATVTETAR